MVAALPCGYLRRDLEIPPYNPRRDCGQSKTALLPTQRRPPRMRRLFGFSGATCGMPPPSKMPE